jgi:hypothetical protein
MRLTFHACRADGTKLGELNEAEFQEKIFSGSLTSTDYYWHEGMADWRPIADYRALAKTQRISFAPPMRSTVKIKMETETAKAQSPLGRFVDRLRQSIKSKK